MSTSYESAGYSSGTARPGHLEGQMIRAIEQRLSKLPSGWFLWAGIGSLVGTLAWQAVRRRGHVDLIGLVAPTFLVVGLYNELVKGARDRRGRPPVH